MIKKHFKKLVSVALSAVMVMGMSVTAFAAENQTSTDLQSAYNNIVKYAETNNIDLSMDYQEFINSYNGSSVQAYEQSYYSILAPQTANTRSSSGYNIPITVDTRISVVPTFRTPSPFVSLFINTPLSNTFFLDTLFQM